MSTILGNDVSFYQEEINFDTFKNNANFIIEKASEGIGLRDPQFTRNQSEARRVGIPVGYYDFSHPELNDPIKEADYFLQQIGALQNGEVLFLDYEPKVKVHAHVDWCKQWLDYVTQKTGCKPLIYMSESTTTLFDWQSVVDAGYGLWIAKYLDNPTPNFTGFNTGKWPFAAVYQWTNKQQVPGISPVTDGDIFYGDQATFKKYGYHGSGTPTPLPPVPPTAHGDQTLVDLGDLGIQQIQAIRSKLKDMQQTIINQQSQISSFSIKNFTNTEILADIGRRLTGG